MNYQRCFLFGHRDAPAEIYTAIVAAAEEHIVRHGVTEFLVGHYGAFDRMATKAVVQLKQRYAHVRLVLLLPYHPAEKKPDVPEGFDDTLYPDAQEFVPKRLAIVRANRYAVEHSQYLIAYAWQPGSNARKLLDYAQTFSSKGKFYVTSIPHQQVFTSAD